MKLYSKLLLATLTITMLSSAQNTIVTPKDSDIKITVYNGNRAFIDEHRSVEIEDSGKQKLVYEGVPSSLITPSVIPSLTGLKTMLYSQNFVYDLVSLESMLNKSIDKEVKYYTNGKEPTLSKGTLISAEPVMVRDSDSGEILSLEKPTQVIFSSVPANMITKPSLVWNIDAKDDGKLDIDLKYLTKGITWKSDYVLNLHGDTLDLNGWITIKNDSGVGYKNAQIACLAGDVNMVHGLRQRPRVMKRESFTKAADMANVAEESFSGYHLYKIPFRETIANNEQKQISFITQKDVPFHSYGLNVNNNFDNYGEQKLSFNKIIEINNTKENNMGLPLPKGTVRMYEQDSSKQTHFIGEQRIKATASNELLKLSSGKLFDIAGEKKITKYTRDEHYMDIETTYSVRNQGKKDIELRIQEHLPRYGRNIKIKTSCKGICSVEKKTAFYREFTIQLKANQSYEFTTELESNF